MDLRIGGKWVLRRRLGGGSFGEIYSGEHLVNKESVAVKLESVNARPPQLLNESRAYRTLSGGVGIPSMKWYGVEGDYSVMVMDLLGKSLEDLFEQCGRKFSLKTVLMIADQLLARIEYLHNKNILHRDIKPENFVIGTAQTSNLIYVIDLGLSKKYKDSKTGQHIPFREGKSLLGTARYTSVNTHLGIEQSRRDDLESIAYILIYFMKGTLPWIGLKEENKKQKYEAITEKKIVTGVEVLCQGLHPEFGIFLNEVRRLDFADRPDYEVYRKFFRDLFVREGYIFDSIYDWVKVKPSSIGLPIEVSTTRLFEDPSHPATLMEFTRRNNPSAPLLPLPAVKTPVVKAAIVDHTANRLTRKPGGPQWMIHPVIKTVQRAIRAV
jgi:serine/threonine protein kinase